VWLICRAALGRGKNKLLIRGIKGTQWVFCPLIKNTKRDRVSTDQCQGCKHFIRFEQTNIPQTPTTRKTLFLRTTALKSTFHFARTLSISKTKHQRVTFFHHIPSLTKERQPLVDIFEEEDHLTVLAELPGIDEKDIKIKAYENTLTITADTPKKKYLEKIQLPTPIRKDKIKFTYKNNILQVRLEKL